MLVENQKRPSSRRGINSHTAFSTVSDLQLTVKISHERPLAAVDYSGVIKQRAARKRHEAQDFGHKKDAGALSSTSLPMSGAGEFCVPKDPADASPNAELSDLRRVDKTGHKPALRLAALSGDKFEYLYGKPLFTYSYLVFRLRYAFACTNWELRHDYRDEDWHRVALCMRKIRRTFDVVGYPAAGVAVLYWLL